MTSKENIGITKTLLKQLNTSVRVRMSEISLTYCDGVTLVQIALMSLKSTQCIFEHTGIRCDLIRICNTYE